MPYQLVNVVVPHLFADSLRRKWSTLIKDTKIHMVSSRSSIGLDHSNLKYV
jgi:hypothetical protein